MAKLKLDKDSLKAFFFNHVEKIVLGVVLLMLPLFIWTGSSLEGIGAQNPAELASKVEAVANKIEKSSWETIKENYPVTLDHEVRQQLGRAPTSESYYRLDKPFIGSTPNSATPRQDPQLLAPTDVEATVVIGALAFKARKGWTDPFAELANTEQKKIEAPKKRSKKKKKSMGASSMDMSAMMGSPDGGEEGDDDSMYGPGGMSSMYGAGGDMSMAGAGGGGPSLRADANKFDGYRPTSLASATGGPSVLGRPYPIVSVKALVPYQKQWDEFERVFADASGYQPSRDIPRYLAFAAERAEVPSDPNQPLTWERVTNTRHALDQIPLLAYAGYPGELADPKYLLPGILTMPVPPVMMRDLRPLALHSKVPMVEVAQAKTATRTGPELADVAEPTGVAAIDEAPVVPRAGQPGMGAAGGMGMYGAGAGGMYGGGGMEGMEGEDGSEMATGMGGSYGYGGGMGGMGVQAVRGPQAEFLMVRFFDIFTKPNKQYVYRVRVVLEDPNHPQFAQNQPLDRSLADTVRARLASMTADEAKKSAAAKVPVRNYMILSEWSEPTPPVSWSLTSETYAGGVALPRMLDIPRVNADPTSTQKISYSLPADGEPEATVMSLSWDTKYATDVAGIVKAPRGAYLNKSIPTDVIDPISLTFKNIPDYPLASGELVVDLRGGEILEPAVDDADPLLTPGEVAVIDATGNFIVRNELDDWQIVEKYSPPPPIVVESASSSMDPYEGAMGAGDVESLYGE